MTKPGRLRFALRHRSWCWPLGLLLCASACKREQSSPGDLSAASDASAAAEPSAGEPARGLALDVKLDDFANPATIERAEDLARQVSRLSQFPLRERTQRENAEAFLYLAARGETPEVVAAALDALPHTFSNVKAPDRAVAGETFRRVVELRLRSEHRPIVARALAAAAVCLTEGGVDSTLLETVQQVGRELHSPEGRLAVLNAVQYVPRGKLPAAFEAQLLDFLQPESAPQLLARGAEVLADILPVNAAQERVGGLRSLLQHENAAVRAQVGRLLSFQRGREANAWLLPLLKDASGHVRATIADALSRTADTALIAELMELIDDSAPARETLGGWTSMDGTPGSLVFGNPTRPTVAVAAQLGIARLAPDAPAPKPGVGDAADANAKSNAAQLRAWFAKRARSAQGRAD